MAILTRNAGCGEKTIDDATGRIYHVYPEGSSPFDYGVYTALTLQDEDLAESDPVAHADQVKRGFIGFISVETIGYRTEHGRSKRLRDGVHRSCLPVPAWRNTYYARTRFIMAEGIEEFSAESELKARIRRT